MSTKISDIFIDTEIFKLHLYGDFAGKPGIEVEINGASVCIPITEEERVQILKELKSNFKRIDIHEQIANMTDLELKSLVNTIYGYRVHNNLKNVKGVLEK